MLMVQLYLDAFHFTFSLTELTGPELDLPVQKHYGVYVGVEVYGGRAVLGCLCVCFLCQWTNGGQRYSLE